MNRLLLRWLRELKVLQQKKTNKYKKNPANYENIIGNNVLQILTMQPNTETRYKY